MKLLNSKNKYQLSIVLCVNIVDEKGNNVGHFSKQLMQSINIAKACGISPSNIQVISPIIRGVDKRCQKDKLPFEMHQTDKPILFAFKTILNYLYAVAKIKANRVWFPYFDKVILACMGLISPGQERYIVGTVFLDWERFADGLQGIEKHVFCKSIKRGLSRINYMIYTLYAYRKKSNAIFLPDYYISKKELTSFNNEKKRQMVCLGEIRRGKQVDYLAKTMAQSDIPLIIAGRFVDDQLYKKTKQIECVEVRNRFISREEYAELLQESKYVAIPYDMKIYAHRTSGVLLEAIYAGAIPVAPQQLLEENNISGIGYKNVSQIPELINKYENGEIQVRNDITSYKIDSFADKLRPIIATY